MVTLVLDGQTLEVAPGSMIIEAADAANIYIPRFCYHNKLSIAANCRMCLVEVQKSNKPLPACATPVTDGMVVHTRSALATQAQKGVMEFLLMNHPLDCPVCDQAGECELQDLSLGYGKGVSRFSEGKRAVQDQNLGPLIATEMTRCIHCTRCVRFGSEIAGLRELGATCRGEHMQIGTAIEQSLQSELSGNIIDLCPVGALTSKPFRFKIRSWELTQASMIAPHDGVGSALYAHTHDNKVWRVVPKVEESVNENWISDRDRYGYLGNQHAERLGRPRIKQNGVWQEMDWNEAFEYCQSRFANIIETQGAEAVGALISPQATLEEGFLLQKLMRSLGSGNIDFRLKQMDTRDDSATEALWTLGHTLVETEHLKSVVVIGSDVRQEHPLLAHRLRKAVKNGAVVFGINPADFTFHIPIKEQWVPEKADLLGPLQALVKVLLPEIKNSSLHAQLENLLREVPISEKAAAWIDTLKAQGTGAIWLGPIALAHPASSELRFLARVLAETLGFSLGYLSEGPNAVGLQWVGCTPAQLPFGQPTEQVGKSAHQMLETALAAYILFQVEPQWDTHLGAAAMSVLGQAECVIACTSFVTPELEEIADILLPIATPYENSGSYINLEGRTQRQEAVIKPFEEAREGWKVLRMLGTILECNDFYYDTLSEVQLEVSTFPQLQHSCAIVRWTPTQWTAVPEGIVRFTTTAPFSTDALVRRSDALQQTETALAADAIHVHPALAQKLHLECKRELKVQQVGKSCMLPLVLNPIVPMNTVWIASGRSAALNLSVPFGTVDLA